jgi:hypothetical protein
VNSTPTRRSILASLLFALVALPLGTSCAPKNQGAAPDDDKRTIATASRTQVPAAEVKPLPPPIRVLFIGNSYTFYNGGVDAVFQAMAKSRGKNVEAVAVTSGGKTLEWHWENGDARSAIERGGWDYVVLQEFSTRPIDDPELMFTYARRFDQEIKRVGAKTVFYLTWARFNQPENQIVLNRAYDKIARELNATVARVGPAWERVLEDTPRIKLHMEDRSHPTPAGTYLAAAVFYATILNDSAEGLPSTITTASGKRIQIDPANAKDLQRAAMRAATPQGD